MKMEHNKILRLQPNRKGTAVFIYLFFYFVTKLLDIFIQQMKFCNIKLL